MCRPWPVGCRAVLVHDVLENGEVDHDGLKGEVVGKQGLEEVAAGYDGLGHCSDSEQGLDKAAGACVGLGVEDAEQVLIHDVLGLVVAQVLCLPGVG